MYAKALTRGFLTAGVLASAVAASAQTSLQLVTVGNPGNAADPATGSLYGAVPYTYKIGTYDVTLGQYTEFLNAVAKTDTYGLYNSGMGSAFTTLGIQQSGSSGNYSYSVTGSYSQGVNCPIFDVTWGDAARFCNWLQNGQPARAEGNGTTETGAYTLSGATSTAALMAVTRNANATYFIPSQNEWYKAAYYMGGGTNAGYWTYPTKSNSVPTNVLSTTGTNNANYLDQEYIHYGNGGYTDPTNYLTPVGAFADSPGPYGTYDMGGDVWQWNEASSAGMARGTCGGYFGYYASNLAAGTVSFPDPASATRYTGFRVAGVPEPGSVTLLVAGAVAGLIFWRRWR
jgi:formylglycine-generating enzyme required for sulfatase activity